MKPLCEGFCEPVCQRFYHDTVVVIAIGFVFPGQFISTDARSDREGADIILNSSFLWRHIICK